MLDPIEISDPHLTASVVAGYDPITPALEQATLDAAGRDFTVPTAADGTSYFFDKVSALVCDGRIGASFYRLMRIRPAAGAQEVLRLHTGRCLECSGGSCMRYAYGPRRAEYDGTNGVLLIAGAYRLLDSSGVDLMPPQSGVVRVSGFPTTLDTIVTAALTPTHHDDFRVAPPVWSASSGSIEVLVRDKDGTPTRDARVTLIKGLALIKGEGVVGEVRTGEDGRAAFKDLEPAQDYAIQVAQFGYSTVIQSDVGVYDGPATSVSFTLRPRSDLSGF